ncbi:hypothetical protein HD554DRAFT_352277 [Boletus coccyginus]|nr:hypothetical protein HD554DRAFT_352277 [Boletus coccyginus]
MLVFAPALLLSFLALVSSVTGGVVGGAGWSFRRSVLQLITDSPTRNIVARDVVSADAGDLARRSADPATPPPPSSLKGALFEGRVHQKLTW